MSVCGQGGDQSVSTRRHVHGESSLFSDTSPAYEQTHPRDDIFSWNLSLGEETALWYVLYPNS